MSMLRIYLMLFIITTANSFAQSTCTTSAAFCANNTTGSTFPAGVNNGSAAAGPDYGCLLTTPNPAWYYFQVSSGGTIIIGIAGTGGLDVDFICWGPFTSPNGNCGNLTAGNTVDCSYLPSPTETCTINNAIAGQYYTLLLTNFANQAQNINFNQVGGSGSTNCSLIAPVTSATICAGQSATISANTNLTNPTFLWSPGGLTTQTIVVSPIITTIYSVTVSGLDASNTPTTIVGSGTVTVSSPPSVAITPTSSSICLGQSIGLTASGAGTFVWTASSGTSPSAAANVTVTPNATTAYTVISGVGSCTSSAVATVSVTTSSSISITPSLSTICAGQSIGLSVSGAGPYGWTASSGANPASAANVTVTPSSTTSYTVISGVGTCTSSAVATVSVNTVPVISITPSLTTICVGQNVALTTTGAGPYNWTVSSGINPPSVSTITVNPTITTTYTVLSGSGSCTAQAVATVSIGITPAITITPTNTTICLGASTSLSASGSGPFVWTASSGSNPASAANITVTPNSTTTYTVLSGTGACTTTAIATVSIAPTLSISITPSNTIICLGANANLVTSGTGPFVWTASSGANPGSSSSIIVAPVVNTTYTVLSGTGACTAQAVATVSIAPALTVTIINSNSVICSGQTSNLTCSGSGPFNWTASVGPNPSPLSTVIVNPTTSTTYTVLAGTGACTAQAVSTVNVLPIINPTLIAPSNTVCITNYVIISAPFGTGLTYSWQPSNAISGSNNTSSIVAVPPSTSTVIYTVTISNGVCSDSDTIQLKVKTPPSINSVTTLNNDTICVGGCVTFSVNTSGTSPIYYQWYYETGIGTSSVGIAPEACYPSAGVFSVIATASNVCGFDTLVRNNFITVFDMPVLSTFGDTTINIGETASIMATGGLNYNWTPNINNSIACETCSNTVVQPLVSTKYIVVASNSQYCVVQDTVKIIVDIDCGDFFIPNVFSPNDDGLNDLINVHGRCISTYNLQIFSRWGEKVFETSSTENSWDGTYKGKKMDKGVFVYKADGVSIDGQSFRFKGNITLIR